CWCVGNALYPSRHNRAAAAIVDSIAFRSFGLYVSITAGAGSSQGSIIIQKFLFIGRAMPPGRIKHVLFGLHTCKPDNDSIRYPSLFVNKTIKNSGIFGTGAISLQQAERYRDNPYGCRDYPGVGILPEPMENRTD